MSQTFCLDWNNYHASLTDVFNELRLSEELVDVTLSVDDGTKLSAHRTVLSACSPYFRNLFKDVSAPHLVFFMRDTSVQDLRAIVEFMYRGSVNVSQQQLASFIRTAEILQIRGLYSDPLQHKSTFVERRPPPLSRCSEIVSVSSQTSPPPTLSCSLAECHTTRKETSVGCSTVTHHVAPITTPQPASQTAAGSPASVRSGLSDSGDEAALISALSAHSPGTCQTAEVQQSNTHVHCRLKQEQEEQEVGEYSGSRMTRREKGGGADLEDAEDLMMAERIELGDLSVMSALSETQCLQNDDPNSLFYHDVEGSSNGEYACPFCWRKYRHRSSLRQHIQQHRGRTTCKVCGKSFTRIQILKQHLLSCHHWSEELVMQEIVKLKYGDLTL